LDFKAGRYGTSGESSGTFGQVHIKAIFGSKLDESGFIVGPDEPVLYFAISLPESHTGDSPRVRSEATRTVWHLGHGPSTGGGIHVEVVWDRAADVVILGGNRLNRTGDIVPIEGRRFDRTAGNVFLIETGDDGTPVFRQNSRIRNERDIAEERVIEEEFPRLGKALRTRP
jgi:hypothetical protein